MTATRPRPGAIFRAICDRPLKGQGGMMLRLPDGRPAFCARAKGLQPGQALLVQVTGYAEDGKAVPVTDRVLFKSRYAIVTPGAPGINVSRQIADEDARVRLREIADEVARGRQRPDPALVLRRRDDAEIAEDIAAMRDLADAVLADADGHRPRGADRGRRPACAGLARLAGAPDVVTDAAAVSPTHGVLDQIEALEQPAHRRWTAGTMYVEPTRALVAVDVNTGGDTSPAAALKANLAAARALPRALRLRGLGGQITVDFAPMSKAHRKQVEQIAARRLQERPDRDLAGRLDAAGPVRTAAQTRTPAAGRRIGGAMMTCPICGKPQPTRNSARSARNAAPMSIWPSG